MSKSFLLLAFAASFLAFAPANSFAAGWSQFAHSPGPTGTRHDDVYFTDPTNGWATQDHYIYRTTNGGATWTTNFYDAGAHFRSIGFLTPLIGYAGNLGVGSYDGALTDTNVIYGTRDGGVTWSNVPGFAEVGMKGLCSMAVLDSQHIYGAGRVRGPAFFICSTNGGTNWTITNLTAANVMNGIMDVYFSDPTNGWLVGMDTNQFTNTQYYGSIARTTNAGATWQVVLTVPVNKSYFWKMAWPATNVCYVSLQQNNGYSAIIYYKSTDGGSTWVSNGIPLTAIGRTDFYLQGLGFVTTNEGWLGGASGTAYSSSFLHTTDGGVTWVTNGFNDTYYINRIRFLSPNLGFASGDNIYTYTNPLVITQQPQSLITYSGSNATLSVAASSTQPVSYQWQMNGSNLAATTPQLTLTNVTRSVEGIYTVVVSNASASLISSNATVRLLAAERFTAPQLLPGGNLQLLFNDADGGALLTTNDLSTFVVQVSTNLSSWTTLTNALSITNGSILLIDSYTNSPSRFYRVLEH